MIQTGSVETGRLPSGRHELPRDAVIRSQRTRILKAMAESCAEWGYAATTVGQIVEQAGVSTATFYELFRDKEDCFLALVRDIIAQATTVISETYTQDKPSLELLRDGILAVLQLMAAEPAFARVVFLECRSSTRALDLYMSGARAALSIMGRGWGTPPPGRMAPSTTSRVVLGGVEAVIRNEITHGRAEQLPEVLPELLYCCLVPFLGKDLALEHAERERQRAANGRGRVDFEARGGHIEETRTEGYP